MSMMRASGAMPIMTALQMATASLATPKSVMNTMAGRTAGFCGADEVPYGPDCGLPQPTRVKTDRNRTPWRTPKRMVITLPPRKMAPGAGSSTLDCEFLERTTSEDSGSPKLPGARLAYPCDRRNDWSQYKGTVTGMATNPA